MFLQTWFPNSKYDEKLTAPQENDPVAIIALSAIQSKVILRNLSVQTPMATPVRAFKIVCRRYRNVARHHPHSFPAVHIFSFLCLVRSIQRYDQNLKNVEIVVANRVRVQCLNRWPLSFEVQELGLRYHHSIRNLCSSSLMSSKPNSVYQLRTIPRIDSIHLLSPRKYTALHSSQDSRRNILTYSLSTSCLQQTLIPSKQPDSHTKTPSYKPWSLPPTTPPQT